MKKADSQHYDLTWEKLEKVFGDNPNWKDEIDAYTFIFEQSLEDYDIVKDFDIIVSDISGASRERFNQFRKMIISGVWSASPENTVSDQSEEDVRFHNFKTIDELLKHAQQDAIKREEQSPEFNEPSAWSKDVTLQDTSTQNTDEVVIEQTVSEDDSRSTTIDYNKK